MEITAKLLASSSFCYVSHACVAALGTYMITVHIHVISCQKIQYIGQLYKILKQNLGRQQRKSDGQIKRQTRVTMMPNTVDR